jgi:4a-hydroxytetrahydrobiopterin dehydratase
VRERPVQVVADELAGRGGFERAPEGSILPVVSVPEGWRENDGALERELTFESFREAVAFVDRLAELAESANHHPDISLSYKRVIVRWTSHSDGGITDRDSELAARTDDLV